MELDVPKKYHVTSLIVVTTKHNLAPPIFSVAAEQTASRSREAEIKHADVLFIHLLHQLHRAFSRTLEASAMLSNITSLFMRCGRKEHLVRVVIMSKRWLNWKLTFLTCPTVQNYIVFFLLKPSKHIGKQRISGCHLKLLAKCTPTTTALQCKAFKVIMINFHLHGRQVKHSLALCTRR